MHESNAAPWRVEGTVILLEMEASLKMPPFGSLICLVEELLLAYFFFDLAGRALKVVFTSCVYFLNGVRLTDLPERKLQRDFIANIKLQWVRNL